MPADQPLVLTVVTPFGNYNRGDVIYDQNAAVAALEDNPAFVVQIDWVAGEPTPEAHSDS